MALFSLLLLSLAVNAASSARIAGFWTVGGSQYSTMRQIMSELASKGHEVLFASRVNSQLTPSNGLAKSDAAQLAAISSERNLS